MRLVCLALATTLVASTPPPPPALRPAGPSIFDPYTRTSPDGAWTVLVDPTQRYGDGPADYTVKHAGELVWSGRHAWTLRDAAVDDAGRVAGFGYTEERPPAALPGALHIVMLSPVGAVVLDERHARSRSTQMHGTPWPYGIGVYVQPELDRFVVRIDERDGKLGSQGWRGYRASDGSELFRMPVDASTFELGWRSVMRAVRGTPLTCVRLREWMPGSREDVRCVLLDADLVPVWRSELLDGSAASESDCNEAQRAFDLDPENGRFAVALPGVRETVRFAVERAGDNWSAREVSRTPWSPHEPRRTLPAYADLPTTELTSRGVVALESVPGTVAEPSGGAVDAHGRALVVDAASGEIHVHEARGRRLFSCSVGADARDRLTMFNGLCATSDGGLLLQTRVRSVVRRFGPDGVERDPLRVSGRTYNLAASSMSDDVYAGTMGEGFVRVATATKGELAFDRAPDRTWMRGGGSPTVGRNGTIAVTGSAGRGTSGRALLLYETADPNAVRVVTLPDAAPARFTSLGLRWAVVWEWSGDALLAELSGERRLRIRMPGPERKDGSWKLGFDPASGELLALDVPGRVLHRYAIPD